MLLDASEADRQQSRRRLINFKLGKQAHSIATSLLLVRESIEPHHNIFGIWTLRLLETRLDKSLEEIPCASVQVQSTPDMGAFPLHALPEELLQSILDYLAKPDLLQLSLASRWCREIATSLAWRQVELVDCRTFYTESGAVHSSGPGSQGGTVGRIPAGAVVRSDEHDDTPLIRKLWVLAT